MRTELLKLQITSPGCESRSARSRHVSGMDCDGDGIVCLDLDHNTESLDRGVSSHLTPYTAPPGHWSPCSVLWTSDICILTFCILQCSVPQLLQSVYDRSQIYSRAPGPAGQWSVCSMWSPVANNVRALSS